MRSLAVLLGLIGDPSFKDAERSLQTKDTVDGWVKSIQGTTFVFLTLKMAKTRLSWSTTTTGLAASASLTSSVISENTFTVNYMMSKESVKNGLKQGFLYTEFAYQIMQGYDFFVLNQDYNVTLQIGGSDQWGNMDSWYRIASS